MNRIMEAGHGLRGGQPHPLPEMASFSWHEIEAKKCGRRTSKENTDRQKEENKTMKEKNG